MLVDKITFIVKTYQKEHTCIRAIDHHNINHICIWIVKKLKSRLSVDLYTSYELMQNELREKWGVELLIW